MSEFYDVVRSRYLNRYMTVLSKKRDANTYDFRHLIQNKVLRARLDQGNCILEVHPEDYLLASFNEIVRYMGKGLIAYYDFCLEPRLTSRSWRYVTLYYSLYFFAILFGRIAGQSVIYLDSIEASALANLVAALSGSDYQLCKGNYVLVIDKPDEPIVTRSAVEIRVVNTGNNGSHEIAWSQFYDILNSWRAGFRGRSLVTLTGIRNSLAKNTSVFSETRNRLNYRGRYTFLELDEGIVFLGPDKRSKCLDELDREISLITRFTSASESSVLQVSHTLGSFFFALFSVALNDLHSGQPHPGSHYIKQLTKRFEVA
jgi:hypothetical protein